MNLHTAKQPPRDGQPGAGPTTATATPRFRSDDPDRAVAKPPPEPLEGCATRVDATENCRSSNVPGKASKAPFPQAAVVEQQNRLKESGTPIRNWDGEDWAPAWVLDMVWDAAEFLADEVDRLRDQTWQGGEVR
jgi:hypothetical protein